MLVLASIGALGALPGSRSGPDPIGLLAWLALWSLPAGVIAGAKLAAPLPLAAVVPALWMVLLALVDAGSPRDLPAPAWAASAWTGAYALGFGAGRLAPRRVWPHAALCLAAAGAVSMLASASAWMARPWSPALRARLLDLSPVTFLAECAGLDWLRHPAIYASVDTADIDPALRSAWNGALAGPALLILGLVVAFVGIRRARRLQPRAGCG